MYKALLPGLLICALSLSAWPVVAQTGDPSDPFEQLLRRMDQQFGRGVFPDSLFSRENPWNLSPDSGFFFRWDTSFYDMGGDLFPQRMLIDPFQPGGLGLDRLLEDFFRQLQPPDQDFPADDGNAPQDLLPEERLWNTPPSRPEQTPKRPTIRI